MRFFRTAIAGIRKFDTTSRQAIRDFIASPNRGSLYLERREDGTYYAQRTEVQTLQVDEPVPAAYAYVSAAGRTPEYVPARVREAVDQLVAGSSPTATHAVAVRKLAASENLHPDVDQSLWESELAEIDASERTDHL